MSSNGKQLSLFSWSLKFDNEAEYVKFSYEDSLPKCIICYAVYIFFFLAIGSYACLLSWKSGTFSFQGPILLSGSIVAAGALLTCLYKREWLIKHENLERMALFTVITMVTAVDLSLEDRVYEFGRSIDCNDPDFSFIGDINSCSASWMRLIINLSLTSPLVCLTFLWMNVRSHLYKHCLGATEVILALRTLVLTPLPASVLPMWTVYHFVALPSLFYFSLRASEISRRRLFCSNMELLTYTHSLEQRLGAAEKALMFQTPTAAEESAVREVLDGSPHLCNLQQWRIPFESLELEQRIGVGSFGEVIKAAYNGTFVAVKRLLRSSIDEDHLKSFHDEVVLLSSLRHPNIVAFVGASWDTAANICIVVELVERGDLTSVYSDPSLRLTWEDPFIRMMIDVSSGLSYLHSQSPPVVHRDMKPDNVLVSSLFSCKVSDLGASRRMVDSTMTVTGTAHYMAPEVLMGKYYTEKVDVYAMGLILAEVHTRERPFRGLDQISARICSGQRPVLPEGVAERVLALVDDCWAPEPDDRPPIMEVLERLRAFQTQWVVRSVISSVGGDDDNNGSSSSSSSSSAIAHGDDTTVAVVEMEEEDAPFATSTRTEGSRQ